MVFIDQRSLKVLKHTSVILNTKVNIMEIVSFEKHHKDAKTKVVDTVKISFSEVAGGLNEIKITRTSTNSRDPKVYKLYFEDQDMFDLEEAVKIYNEGLNRG